MDLVAWASYAAAAALALAVVLYLYRSRETPVRGRWLLAGLRWLVLALLILLAFDPDVSVPGLARGTDETRVLVDASLSMALPSAPEDSTTRWTRAAEEARRLSAGREVILFGGMPATLSRDSLGAAAPVATASRLLPALRTASEAGARRVIVLTDGGLEDADAVARAAASLGLALEVRTVADEEEPGNLALAEIAAPGWAAAGEPIDVRVGVAGVGAVADSVEVVLEHDGRPLARTRIAAPGAGRVATATLSITPEAPGGEPGLVRYDAVVAADDAIDDDDRRTVYVQVSDRPSGIVLLSFRPDWEPRFLQPTLERSLGMPVYGYLAVTAERYLALGAGPDAVGSVDEAEVRRAADEAEMVVLHGLDADAPGWARALAGSAPRVLVFPGDAAGEVELPITLPARSGGEWYAVDEIPPSPVASLLAALDVAELPPLTGVRPARSDADGWTPIELRRGRRGARAPVLLAGEAGARRWAVAMADGYWRWAFRGGDAARAYQRLWSAVGGWLVEDRRGATVAAIRPAERVVERGAPIRWLAPGLEADSVAVEFVPADGARPETGDPAAEAPARRSVAPARADTAVMSPIAPGHYRYRARAYAGGEEVAVADGPLTVSSHSREFTRPRVALDDVAGRNRRAEPDLAGAGGRPLHTTPWPYVALLLVLCTEWALRRRWGLR